MATVLLLSVPILHFVIRHTTFRIIIFIPVLLRISILNLILHFVIIIITTTTTIIIIIVHLIILNILILSVIVRNIIILFLFTTTTTLSLHRCRILSFWERHGFVEREGSGSGSFHPTVAS
jgi:hypothetical protein